MRCFVPLLLTMCSGARHCAAADYPKRVVPYVTDLNRFDSQETRGVALLIGINRYPAFNGFSPLHYAEADVRHVAEELKKQHYLVIAISDPPVRSSLLKAVDEAASSAERANVPLIFYFSGHGFAVNGENFLAVYDSSVNTFAETGVKVSEIEKKMVEAGVRQRMMFIDACRDEPKKSAERKLEHFAAAEGTRILFSARPGGVSYEEDTLEHGVFTKFLLEGLQGAAAKSDNLISFRDLADHVTFGVDAYSLKHNRSQTPFEAGQARLDFLVGRRALIEPNMRLVQ